MRARTRPPGRSRRAERPAPKSRPRARPSLSGSRRRNGSWQRRNSRSLRRITGTGAGCPE
eukprot:862488-Lingulodinium_polyedra.AAC.1